MRREFFNAESQHTVAVLAPYDESFVTIDGDSDERKPHVFSDNVEAIAGCIAYVGTLLADGYLELAPWVSMSRGDETMEVRPPAIPRLEVRTGETIQSTDYDSLIEAVSAYNEFAAQHLAEGWVFVLPKAGDFEIPADFEEVIEYDEDLPSRVEKTYCRRRTDPHDEFGPELWYRGGTPYIFNFQLQTEVAGPIIQVDGAALRGVQTFHDGLSHGPTLLFDPESGFIRSLALHTGPDGKRLNLVFEDGRLAVEAPDGVTGDGKNRGLWTKYEEDGRYETLFEPPDHRRWFKSYDLQDRLLTSGQYDDDGEKIGTWIETDAENRVISVYRDGGVFASITWERHDGTLELYKEFDEGGRNTVITFHDEDGDLNERRLRLDDGWQSVCYHAGSEVVRERAGLDSDGKYHGVRMEYDISGELVSETTWNHGEKATPGTDPDATPVEALFACLEAPSRSSREAYGGISARTTPLTLEEHLARFYCIAAEDVALLSTAKAGWTHRSENGSTLKLKRRKSKLVGATLLRADGTLAAQARFLGHKPGSYCPPHVEVELYYDDGTSVRRAGALRADYPWNDQDHVHCTRDAWWFEYDVDGRIRRAQGFTQGSVNLAADFPFTDDFYDLSVEQPDAAFAEFLDQARALAGEAPSREGFLAIAKVVEQASIADRDRVVTELVPYLREAIEEWPVRIRVAPWLWINRLTANALPIEALELVSAISLTGALDGHYLDNPQYPLLLSWLAAYPEDGPAPMGISMSFRDDVAKALGRACGEEPHARYHPAGELDFDETYHTDPGDHEAIFGSPLMRKVRILDMSWEPSSWDFYSDHQGILDGRGLTVANIVESLPSEELEVLDLFGQTSNCTDQVRRTAFSKHTKQRLANLRELNLGGGHPIGDEAVKVIANTCPSLRALSLWPGQAAAALDGYDFDEADDGDYADSVYRMMSDYWNIYGNDFIDRMRLTKPGWKALAKLPLERVDLGAVHVDHELGGDVSVAVRSFYAVRETPRIAAWENYFDV